MGECDVQVIFGGQLRKYFGVMQAMPLNSSIGIGTSEWKIICRDFDRNEIGGEISEREDYHMMDPFIAQTRWDLLTKNMNVDDIHESPVSE